MATKNRIFDSKGKKKYFNYLGAAEELGISRTALVGLINRGKIKVSRIPVIHQNEIRRYSRSRKSPKNKIVLDPYYARDEFELELVRMRGKGYTYAQIAEVMNVSKQYAHQISQKINARQERQKKEVEELEES